MGMCCKQHIYAFAKEHAQGIAWAGEPLTETGSPIYINTAQRFSPIKLMLCCRLCDVQSREPHEHWRFHLPNVT